MNHLLRTLTTTLLIALPSLTALAAQPLDRIVAIVNDEVIVQTELNERVAAILAQLAKKDAELPPRNVIERPARKRKASSSVWSSPT